MTLKKFYLLCRSGRVDNIFDLRILRSYLYKYFNEKTFGHPQLAIDNDVIVPLSENVQVFQFFKVNSLLLKPYYIYFNTFNYDTEKRII